MTPTRVKDLMKESPIIIPSSMTLQEAAEKMELMDCGVLPVGTADLIEGVITDRDIVVRAVAKGKDMRQEKVGDYMTPKIHACNAEDSADHAAAIMRDNAINRLLVKDDDGKLCGVLTFGHIIRKNPSMTEIASAIECAVGRKAA